MNYVVRELKGFYCVVNTVNKDFYGNYKDNKANKIISKLRYKEDAEKVAERLNKEIYV